MKASTQNESMSYFTQMKTSLHGSAN